jgi:hypothetical protein
VTNLPSRHQARAFGGFTKEIVAANVGLLLEKGGKESIHHLALGSFSTAEPRLERETVRVGGLTSLSGEFASKENHVSKRRRLAVRTKAYKSMPTLAPRSLSISQTFFIFCSPNLAL